MYRLIDRTSHSAAMAPITDPTHWRSNIERPQTIKAIITAIACQPIAASGLLLDNDCLPAANHSNETPTPQMYQYLAARFESSAIKTAIILSPRWAASSVVETSRLHALTVSHPALCSSSRSYPAR